MKNIFSYLSVAFLLLGIAASSCERGRTIGTTKVENGSGEIPWDSFAGPGQYYFFYGIFDGSYRLWQHNRRSVWDTATRVPSISQDGSEPWTDWPAYTDNIYVNVCDEGIIAECPDEAGSDFYQHEMRFIRRDFPEERLIINLYKCVNFVDTFTSQHFFLDSTAMINEGAWPFSNLQRGEWGAEIVYVDDNFTRWKTDVGSGKSEDSYFRITDFYPRNPNRDTTDTFALHVIEGEFAGRLFNPNGEAIVITDSKFRSRIFAREPENFN